MLNSLQRPLTAARARSFFAWVLLPLLAFVTLSSWAVSSPAGSSPDDDFHMPSIWCAAGDVAGQCESTTTSGSVRVPSEVASTSYCYSRVSEQSAACIAQQRTATLAETTRHNGAGDYPPLFYRTMSFFVGDDVQASAQAMKIANAALVVALMTAVTALAPRRDRAAILTPLIAVSVPTTLFILPSTNPSSWAILSAAVVWSALVGYFDQEGVRRWALGALALVGLVIGAGARADAAVFAVIAAVAVSILKMRARREFFLAAILPAILSITAYIMFRSTGQSSLAETGFAPDRPNKPTGLRDFLQNVVDIPELWVGLFGKWPIGWIDTPFPAIVWVIGIAVFGFLVLHGLAVTDLRKGLAVLTLFASFVLIPAMFQTLTGSPVGIEVQPRYLIPLAIMLLGVALYSNGAERSTLSLAQLLTLGSLLAFVQMFALHREIRRYTSGLDVAGFNLNRELEWWWPGLPSPLIVWLAGSAAFALFLLGCIFMYPRQATRDPRAYPLTHAAAGTAPSADPGNRRGVEVVAPPAATPPVSASPETLSGSHLADLHHATSGGTPTLSTHASALRTASLSDSINASGDAMQSVDQSINEQNNAQP